MFLPNNKAMKKSIECYGIDNDLVCAIAAQSDRYDMINAHHELIECAESLSTAIKSMNAGTSYLQEILFKEVQQLLQMALICERALQFTMQEREW